MCCSIHCNCIVFLSLSKPEIVNTWKGLLHKFQNTKWSAGNSSEAGHWNNAKLLHLDGENYNYLLCMFPVVCNRDFFEWNNSCLMCICAAHQKMAGFRDAAHPLAFITTKCAAPTVTSSGLVRMLLHTKMACYNNQELFQTHIFACFLLESITEC